MLLVISRISQPRDRGPAAGPFRPLAVWLLLCGALACAPPDAPRYEDLIAGDRLTSSFSGGGSAQQVCGAETHFAQAVRPGETLEATLSLGAAPRLVLSACRRQPIAGDPSSPPGEPGAELRVTVSDGKRTLTDAWPLSGETGWWRGELDLAELAGREVTVRLDGAFAGPRRAFVKELFVEHELPAPTRRGRPPQILLISIDTLRHDAVSLLGGAVPTPGLDRLVADGEVFAPHYAGSSWTKPSHATLLTGYDVGVHRAAGLEAPIHPTVPTLAERFQAAGYTTGGLVHDCVWLNPKFGFHRGFDDYRSVLWDAEPLARAAGDWMIERRDRPFFFFLHLFDVHSDHHQLPYEAPGVTPATVAERFGAENYGCREGSCASGLLIDIDRGEIEPIPGEGEILRFLYDGGVQRMDRAIGGLLDDLRSAGLYDDLLIVFTSDHGEAFFEHGNLTHGAWWNEVIQVPLIVKWPRSLHSVADGGSSESPSPRRGGPSAAVDVAATLLAAADLPAEGLPGTDLRTRRLDRPVFSAALWRTVVAGSLKAVVPLDRTAPRHLYDLAADPGETRNLAAEQPEELARLVALLDARALADRDLRRDLAAVAQATGAEAASPLTEEERSRLRALGYLDGAAGGATR